jgi:hypothetical protein
MTRQRLALAPIEDQALALYAGTWPSLRRTAPRQFGGLAAVAIPQPGASRLVTAREFLGSCGKESSRRARRRSEAQRPNV